ncbi:hypothetical protein [Clostridium tagluense]|uniref:Uncharacterized protein n=1 Tax=Clostridium tagluense TaxID=360422 RepID=A0A401UUU8_9CLOT|nr:hypothetical protein [Clostridium tagluense]GCD13311.1 hypothetical protein Ctaglu_49340 [Clostridium tagluense]
MNKDIFTLKNKISKLEIKVTELKNKYSTKYAVALEQELKCKQVTIDSLEFDVDRIGKRYKNATEIIIKLNNDIRSSEDKKIKNKIKKLFIV